MDSDIHFGELEHTAPRPQLRPDQNRHYAVAACGAAGEDELLIYVDIDVMRDIESHASSNTNVELGGVLLGGQYEDHDGRPFVVITDCLRAEHYEASKGSFKFTHETWSDITRKREEFPPEVCMVGWYHTHPGWGVFLSGMDTFICEHFFNKPLDVALVVDPCQRDRAFFEWTGQSPRRLRATTGFHLIASRYRQDELEYYAAQLKGTNAMPADLRYNVPGSSHVPTVLQIADPRSAWIALAVLGMLLTQFLLLGLIAWRLLAPHDAAAIAALEKRAVQIQARSELLDEIVGTLEVAPDGLVDALLEERRKNEELSSVRMGLDAYVRELRREQVAVTREQRQLEQKQQELLALVDTLRNERTARDDTIQTLRQQLRELQGEEEDPEPTASRVGAWLARWKWYLAGGSLLVLLALAALIAWRGPGVTGKRPAHGDTQNGDRPEE